MRHVSLLVVVFASVFAQAAYAGRIVGAHQDWSVFEDKSPKGCWIASLPRSEGVLPDQSEREDVMFFVSVEDGRLVPSFMAGYDIDGFDGVLLSFRDETVMMKTDGNFAWAPDDTDADRIVDMMRAGREMVVSARLNDESITRDVFSLMGATAAMEQALEVCE